MKKIYRYILVSLLLLTGAIWSSQTYGQVISTFPYTENFDAMATCGTICGNACVLSGGWLNNTTDDTQDWTVDAGGTGSTTTGPSGDHTSGTGNYLYFEASSPCFGTDDSAHVESPVIDATGFAGFEMVYWYHMFGSTMGDLHIDARTVTAGVPGPWALDIVPSFTDNVDIWQQQVVNLNAYAGGQFQVRFRFVSGVNYFSDAALDDVTFQPVVPLNISPTALLSPAPPLSAGTYPVELEISNLGTTTITSFNVDWDFNGTPQTTFNYSGSIPANQKDTVVIGSVTVPAGYHEICVVTSLPNGSADMVPGNDSLCSTFCTPLAGVYTVGSGLDFNTPDEAAQAVLQCGISAPVVFNIAPGTYGPVNMVGEIIGADVNNTVTFDGANQSQVTIESTIGAAALRLEATDWVTFRNVSIINISGLNYSWGVFLTDSADHNTIDNCLVRVADNLTTSLVTAITSSASNTSSGSTGYNARYTTISNSQIEGGYYGIRLNGVNTTSIYDFGNKIINNVVTDYYLYGIYMYCQDSMEVMDNEVVDTRNNTNADGIYLNDVANFVVTGNKALEIPDYGLWIADANFLGFSSGSGVVANNMISSLGDRAFYVDDFENTNVYHNTFAGTYGAYINDVRGSNFQNNIFYGTTQSALFSLDATASMIQTLFDYNIYYAEPGANNLISDGGTAHANLGSWQGAVPAYNGSSLEGDPGFLSYFDDLHIVGLLPYDAGNPALGVTFDIDGDPRPLPPSTGVDIGADEFPPVTLDIEPIMFTSPVLPSGAGNADISVEVSNNALDTIMSFSVTWTVNNGAPTVTTWTGTLAPGNTVVVQLSNSYPFPSGTTELCAITSLPNGSPDQVPQNDTLKLNFCTAYAGPYTVGPGQDFDTPAEAAQAMTDCGITSSVTLNIQPGVYGPVEFRGEILGADLNNTVTFQGFDTSLVRIVGVNDTAALFMESTDHVTFKNITLENTSNVSYSWAVFMTDSADYNTIDSCHIQSAPGAPSTLVAAIVSSNIPTSSSSLGYNANHFTLSNSSVDGGYYGVRLNGASTSGDYTVGNRLINNVFSNQNVYPVYMYCQDSMDIVGNKINPPVATSGDGLYLSEVGNFNVELNDLSAMPDWGMYIFDGNTDVSSVDPSRIVNNFISSTTDYGLYLNDVHNVQMFHNTIAGAYGLYANDYLQIDARNNIFVGTTFYAVRYLDSLNGDPSTLFDFNLYYSTPNAQGLIQDQLNTYTDLNTFQNASPGNNPGSVEGDPFFVNGIFDMHLLGALANDAGDNSVNVPVDIDGDVRPAIGSFSVDIGADEFTPAINDAVAGVFLEPNRVDCGDSLTPVVVTIQNLGSSTITSLPITVDITGDVTTTLNTVYTGSLAFGEIDTVLVGTINTFNGGTVNFAGLVILAGDQDNSNDTLQSLPGVQFIPNDPQGFSEYGCGQDTVTLVGVNYPGVGYNWYANINDTTPVAVGNEFTVPSLAVQSTYFLEYQSLEDSLPTNNIDDNGFSGNMFNIVGNSGTNITGFSMYLAAGNHSEILIYVCDSGSYVGYETNSSAWTLLGTVSNFNNPTAGVTRIPLQIDAPIGAGDTVGFFVTTSGSNRYQNGTQINSVINSNPVISILEGIGRGGTNFSSGIYSVRNFVGVVHYGYKSCSSVRTPVTGIQGVGPNVNLGNDTLTCNQPILLDAGNGGNVGPIDYDWNTNDSTQTLAVTTTGLYSVVLTDTNGCVVDDSIAVTIAALPNVNLGPDTTICTGTLVSLDAGNSGSNYDWNNNDTTQTITVGPGLYGVVVTDGNGCIGSDSVLVNGQVNNVNLGNDTTLCDGASLTLDAGPGSSFTWSTTETTQTINVNTAGTYSVFSQDNLGCIGTDSIDIATNVSPTSAFSFVPGGAGLVYDFTYTGTANVTGYAWDFGDNNTSTMQDPTHTYAAPGTYTVSLIVTNDCGNDTLDQVITVVGLGNVLDGASVNIFPNPNNGQFTYTFTSYEIADVEVQLFNLHGQEVYRQRFEQVNGTIEEPVSLDLSKGMYIMRFTTNGQVLNRRVTID